MSRNATLGIAAALVLGWILGAVMIHPLPANASASAAASAAPAPELSGPNAVRRQAEVPRRHHRARHRRARRDRAR